jgi:hypothetical protein
VIDDEVQSIDMVVRFGNAGNSFIIKTWDKANTTDSTAITNHNAGTTQLSFRFYNNNTGTPLDNVTASNSSLAAPLLAKTMEVARNRVFLGNILSGYDSPKATSIGLTYTDTSTPNTNLPNATATASINGFNTPTTPPLVTVPIAPINNGEWIINNQSYKSCSLGTETNQYPTYPADTDCLFWNTSSVNTYTLSISAGCTLSNNVVDEQISFYFYICGTPNTKVQQKIATFPIKKGTTYNVTVNGQVSVPPNTKIFFVVYNDFGVIGGFNDNNLTVNNMRIWVSNTTTIPYGQPIFKTGGAYQAAVVFYDRFKRKSGIVTQDSAKMNIPRRVYTTFPSNTASWTLSNVNALNEIPSWAYWYQVFLTNNLNTLTFEQGAVYDIRYVKKDPTTGLYTYNDVNYSQDCLAVGVNIRALTDAGLGYVFNDGDTAYLFNDSAGTPTLPNAFNLKVIRVDGDWVHLEKKNVGVTGAKNAWMVEIYTPQVGVISANYYAATPVYAVTNPTLGNRSYSTLTGSLIGDTYFVARTTGVSILYRAEAMNPNDRYWKIWDRNIGWLNIKDPIGQKQKTSTIQFSNTFVNGTKTNGLNHFELTASQDVGFDSGGIMKLQLTAKQHQEDGTVMLVICQSDCLSAYLGEVQLVGSAQNAFVASSAGVIGTINSLRGNYGTLNPESVVDYLGDVYWLDAQNGVMVQYSNNGLFPVSSLKMSRCFYNYSKDYLNTPSATISTLNGFSHIPSCFDPFHRELMIALPGLIDPATAPVLPSYGGVTPTYATSIINRFDIYDKLAKTVTLNIDKNKWISTWEFMPEWMDYVNTEVYGFKNGNLYRFEADTTNMNSFLGVNYPVRLVFTPNANPSQVKDLFNVAIEGNTVPDYAVAYADYPNVQITDLAGTDVEDNGVPRWRNEEGIMKSAWMRDRLSPNVPGTPEYKMLLGDFIKDVAPKIMLEWKAYSGQLSVDFVDVGTARSKGHGNIDGGRAVG